MALQNTTTTEADALLKLPDVLARIPVSRTKWLEGVKSGIFPAPVRTSPRRVAWRASSIAELIRTL